MSSQSPQGGGGGGGSPQEQQQSGPPYLSPGAMSGLVPTKGIDVPIASVLLALFLVMMAGNIAIMRQNKANGTPFRLTILIIVYCLLRVLGLCMRIALANDSANANLTIAATIFASAGAIVLMVLNLFMMPRLMTAFFLGPQSTDSELNRKNNAPLTGWRKLVSSTLFVAPFPLLPLALITTINVSLISFFTTDTQTRLNCLTVQRVTTTIMAVIAFVPAPAALAVAVIGGPKPSSASRTAAADATNLTLLQRITNPPPLFGTVRSNALILLASSALLTLSAAIRSATIYLPSRPRDDPAWYHERATYYIFTFAVELLIVAAYVVLRLDRRFFNPRPQTSEAGAAEKAETAEEDTHAGRRVATDNSAVSLAETISGRDDNEAEKTDASEAKNRDIAGNA